MAKKPAETSKPDLPPPAEGGSYMIKDGVRRRVEEATKDHPQRNTNRDGEGNAVDHDGKVVGGADGRPSNPIVTADGKRE